jgi:hypothetical protein
MRRRITRAFFAAAAAGATITALGLAAGPAGAATARHHPHVVFFNPSAPQTGTDANCASPGFGSETGTWHRSDCAKTGYVATGRDFRFAQAVITVPDHNATSADEAAYVALDASAGNNNFARGGIYPCMCTASGWAAYVDVQQSGTPNFHLAAIPVSLEGDGVFVSIYEVPAGNAVQILIKDANGTLFNGDYVVNGPVYTNAQALADWTVTPSRPAPVPPASDKSRDLQFEQGRFTTSSGDRGTFKGPWSLTAVDGTSNGSLPPSGSLISQPSFLWNDGHSFGGLGNDAFGVWRFPF